MAGSPAILVVGADREAGAIAADLAAALDDYRIESADSVPDAIDVLDRTVSCLVLGPERPPDATAELRAALDERDRSPPIVLAPREIDASVALATTDGVSAIVPPGHRDRLPATVADEADAYLERVGDELQLEAVETLFDAIDDVFQIKDSEGRYLRLLSNREWPAEERALGRTDRDLHESQFDLDERYYEEDRRVLESERPLLAEITEYGDGPLFWLETTKVPLRDDDGEIRGLVGHVRDVSDRMRHRQELERKNRRLDRFAGYVSHDLQNPLSIATGYLELAREGDREALDSVEDAIDRMQQLIDDIEILARSEQRALRTGPEGALVATQQSVATVVRNLWSILETDDATLEVDLSEATLVYAGEQEFRTMIENLLKNAVQHGGDDVTVRLGAVEDGFFIEDDGPGVPPAERDAVFDQGFTTTEGGTGTGLAIVSEVASAYDWSLDVTEGSDGGARFVVGNCLIVADPDRSPTPGGPVELTDAVDVGEPAEDGESHYDAASDTWTLEGSGEDIWGDENDFHFVHATLESDVRIQTRVREMTDVYEYSKAGVMVRDSLAEDSAHGCVGLTRDAIEVLWCEGTGEPTTSQHVENTDGSYEWLRLDREGAIVTTSVSTDGEEWYPIDQRRINYDGPVHAGLVVCSAVHRDRCRATFQHASVRRLSGE